MKIFLISIQLFLFSLVAIPRLAFDFAFASDVIDAPPAPPIANEKKLDLGGPHFRGLLLFNAETLMRQQRSLAIDAPQEVSEMDYYRHRVDQLGRQIHELARMRLIQLPAAKKVFAWSSEARFPDTQFMHYALPTFSPLVTLSFPIRRASDSTKYQIALESDPSYEVVLELLKKVSRLFSKTRPPSFEFWLYVDNHEPLKLEARIENTIFGLQLNLSAPKDSKVQSILHLANQTKFCREIL